MLSLIQKPDVIQCYGPSLLWPLEPRLLASEPGINNPANIANVLGQQYSHNDRSLEKSEDGTFCPSASHELPEILQLSQFSLYEHQWK